MKRSTRSPFVELDGRRRDLLKAEGRRWAAFGWLLNPASVVPCELLIALNVGSESRPPRIAFAFSGVMALIVAGLAGGCGTTRETQATDQLLLSDAVDRSISSIDFRPLSGAKVFLDTTYIQPIKGPMFVNAEYVISSIRQQIMAAGCYVQDYREEADIIIEARCGTLGSDDHRMTYGIPENNALGSAAAFIPGNTAAPQVPELAFARRDAKESAAKIAAFAYDRVSRQPIWQSGISESRSTARDTWVMGVGPFQAGSIRGVEGRARLAGTKLQRFGKKTTSSPPASFSRPPVDYTAETRFEEGWPLLDRRGSSLHMLPSEGALPQIGLLPGDALPPMIATEPGDPGESSEPSESIVR